MSLFFVGADGEDPRPAAPTEVRVTGAADAGPAGTFLRAALADTIDLLLFVEEHAEWPGDWMRNVSGRPTAALVISNSHPAFWPCAKQAGDWCSAAFIVSVPIGNGTLYADALADVMDGGRIVIIETSLPDSWGAALDCPAKTVLATGRGRQ